VRSERFADLREPASRASRSSVAAFTLIELVRLQRAIDLGEDHVGEALVADHDDGLQRCALHRAVRCGARSVRVQAWRIIGER
jgi:hypothetical protein